MSLRIKITSNHKEVERYLRTFRKDVVGAATRKSMNFAVVKTEKEAIKQTQKYYRLTKRILKRKFFSIKKAAGKDLNKLVAEVVIYSGPVPLFLFVRGPGHPRSQKGRLIRQRPLLKIEIKPGAPKLVRRLFAKTQTPKGKLVGTVGVATRLKKGSYPIRRQSAPALPVLFRKRGLDKKLEKHQELMFLLKLAQLMRTDLGLETLRLLTIARRSNFFELET